MTKAAAIHSFWSEFCLMAYEENTVPSEAKMPYITYHLMTDGFNKQVMLTGSLWYRDTRRFRFIPQIFLTEAEVAEIRKTEEIEKKLGIGGVFIKCDGGVIWLRSGTPFAQNMRDENDSTVRRKYLNITAEFLTAD